MVKWGCRMDLAGISVALDIELPAMSCRLCLQLCLHRLIPS